MKLKVCGMRDNAQEVAALRPDYLGFIFWKPSKRFFKGEIPQLPHNIEKIGVFVDAPIEDILGKIKRYGLGGVQLHGSESSAYCGQLLKKIQAELVEAQSKDRQSPKLIKVFSIKDNFDFDQLETYERVCDYYLFDTKGKLPGGNGYTFDWKVLKDYRSTKPYFLSGGIGLGEINAIKEFLKKPESRYCHAIDVNSRFEVEPGLKNVAELKKFKELLITDY